MNSNHDSAEIARFDASAQRWWDPGGEFRPLHDINAARIAYIEQRAPLQGRRVLDVGCGGGLAAEAMAKRGAQVTGIDLGEQTLEVAKLHALDSALTVDYLLESAEVHAARNGERYDVVTCLEMLEHVPDPPSVIAAIAASVKPGGSVFLSTINRNLKAYLLAIVGAEHVLGLLTKGTHSYERFIRPSELARWSRIVNLEIVDAAGIDYNPFSRRCTIGRDTSVNYLLHLTRAQNT
jgi:2-polyprenyl-6-hydroxyphenyl methylase/3-demethylubiquinone-9 3-methyltransferase